MQLSSLYSLTAYGAPSTEFSQLTAESDEVSTVHTHTITKPRHVQEDLFHHKVTTVAPAQMTSLRNPTSSPESSQLPPLPQRPEQQRTGFVQ